MLCTLFPGVHQCDHMVDLDEDIGALLPVEKNLFTGVWVIENAAQHPTRSVRDDVGHVSSQNVVPGIAAIVTALDIDFVVPGPAELRS
ncbi:hypothetical protein AWC30_02750 [Mycolicibacillus trivialis]|uniref:Uncharacterized protein n=1 Tax=Mycolicibacillus trivialis TaxID=1798 RepID=A0A1X2EP78_9MYCO|nr:hypothetical protein AWC30_02750 [Mycolicibacillus trivialis]